MQGLSFFYEQVIPQLGVFNKTSQRFLSNDVPCLAVQESSFRSQTISWGLLHLWAFRQDYQLSAEYTTAWKAYRHAMYSIARNKNASNHLILSSCVLFISIEMFRGCSRAAFMHLREGLRILGHVQPYTDIRKHARNSTLSDIEEMLLQLADSAGMLDDEIEVDPAPDHGVPVVPDGFEDYAHAQQTCRRVSRWAVRQSAKDDSEDQEILLWKRWHGSLALLVNEMCAGNFGNMLNVPVVL